MELRGTRFMATQDIREAREWNGNLVLKLQVNKADAGRRLAEVGTPTSKSFRAGQ